MGYGNTAMRTRKGSPPEPHSLDLPVPPGLLHFLIGVSAIYCQGDVIAVNTEVTVVLVQCLQCGDVGSSGHHFIHPLDGLYHLVPLLLGEHRGPLMLGNLL